MPMTPPPLPFAERPPALLLLGPLFREEKDVILLGPALPALDLEPIDDFFFLLTPAPLFALAKLRALAFFLPWPLLVLVGYD